MKGKCRQRKTVSELASASDEGMNEPVFAYARYLDRRVVGMNGKASPANPQVEWIHAVSKIRGPVIMKISI